MLHYTPPGVVGGVEQVMQRHAALLTQRGMSVEIVAGRPSDGSWPVHVVPELNVAAPDSIRVETELAAGVVSPRFADARASILRQLEPLVRAADVLLVHNAFTLHFCLPLTAVLWQLPGEVSLRLRVLAWTHDLAWVNPLYMPSMHPGYPWDLLRVPAPGVRYVTVSEERNRELRALWGETESCASVVPNGIDLAGLLRLSESTRQVVSRHTLFDREMILLLPVRVTRRKNIEMAIRVIAVLRKRGIDAQLIVSGPTASHHPQRSREYLGELKALRAQLDVEEAVLFLADELGTALSDTEVAELFAFCDCLFLPSESEGFGLPVLEAGAFGMPAVVSRLPIFREVGSDDVSYFALDDEPEQVAEIVLRTLDTPTGRLRRRVRRTFRWEVILEQLLVPLLEGERTGGEVQSEAQT